MSISRMRELLERVQALYASGGAAKQAEAIGQFKQLFEKDDSRLLEEQVAQWEKSTDLVSSYAARLEQSGGNASAFESAFHAMKADSRVKKDHVVAIAELYAKRRFSSKSAALEAIESRFLERARARNEAEYLEKRKVTPW